MARKSPEPLEKKKVTFYAGDWDELASILAPHKIKPTVFVRQLLRKKLSYIRAAAAEKARPLPEIADADIDLDALTAESSDPGEPE